MTPDGLARLAGEVRQDRRRVIAEAILSLEDVIWQEAADVIAWCAADAVLAALPAPDAYQALLTQLHEARAEAARETRRADTAERDLAHIVGRAQHHLDRANAADAREAALRALLADEPLIVHAIRRDLERTPSGRGGDLSVKPSTQGWGKSGCPGDNLTRWLDDLRALLDAEGGR